MESLDLRYTDASRLGWYDAIIMMIKSKKGTYTFLDEKCYLWPATSRVFFATKNARNCLAMVITLKCFST